MSVLCICLLSNDDILLHRQRRFYCLHRRREYYRPNHTNTAVKEVRRRALVPVADVRSGKLEYVFVRANMFSDDVDRLPKAYELQPRSYYGGISNAEKNRLVKNPSQL